MSVARGVPGPDGPRAGEKIVLPRTRDMWRHIELHWAGDNRVRWKALAMLHLHVHCNWSLTMIGKAFGQHRGRVSRLIRNAQRRLAEQFEPCEDILGPIKEDDDVEEHL